MRFISLMSLIMLLTFTSLEAREEFWYMGVGGGATFLEDADDAFNEIDEKSFIAKAYTGYRASNYVAFELEYAYLGEYDYRRLGIEDKADYSALSLEIVVMYPLVIDGLELFTPVGGSAILTDYGDNPELDNKIVFGYKLGFGAAYTPPSYKHFTMRLGVEVFSFEIESTLEDYRQNIASAYATVQYNF